MAADKAPYGETALFRRGIKDSEVRYIRCDAADPESMGKLDADFDYIIHSCAVLGIRTVAQRSLHTIYNNVESCRLALELACRQKELSGFLTFSSSEIYGVFTEAPAETAPAVVGSPKEGRWCYAAGKVLAEHMAMAYYRERQVPVTIIRPFNIFGEYRSGSDAMTTFLNRAMAGEELRIDGDGTQVRAWCHIDDFTEGVTAALEAPGKGEIFNLGNPANEISIRELAERIIEITGSSSRIRITNSAEPDVKYRNVNIDKARKMLGYEPKITLEEGIRRLYEWKKAGAGR